MQAGPPRRRRARPVADAPIDSLLTRSEDLAKGWLLALLEQVPLDAAPGILAADLSRDGPWLCEAVLRALLSDNDLRRLEPGGALAPLAARTGQLAGAEAPESISLAVDALQAVIWAGLSVELHDPEPALVADLAERLALVTERLRSAALRRSAAGPAGSKPTGVHLAPEPTAPAPPEAGSPQSGPAESAPPEFTPPPSAQAQAQATPAPATPEPAEATLAQAAAAEAAPPAAAPAQSASATPAAPDPLRDRSWPAGERPEEPETSQALWIGALEDEIHRAGGGPLSLLLAELEDADRVTAVDGAVEAGATFSEFAQAVRTVVRRQDILVCETDTRAWIIARDTGRAGAQALGARLADAVGERRPWRGAALAASVGVAVLGEDGRTSAELMDTAEEARFAAAAAGTGMIRAVPGDDAED